MMKNQLKWRLGRLPDSEEVTNLFKEKVITKEEAREILFNNETVDVKALEMEIKFLREIIDKLASKTDIIKVLYERIPQYSNQPFYQPYSVFCSGGGGGGAGVSSYANGTNIIGGDTTTTTATYCGTTAGIGGGDVTGSNFSDIKTF